LYDYVYVIVKFIVLLCILPMLFKECLNMVSGFVNKLIIALYTHPNIIRFCLVILTRRDFLYNLWFSIKLILLRLLDRKHLYHFESCCHVFFKHYYCILYR